MPRPSAKQKLLEAAVDSFRFHGYKSCTIEDIARKARVFKGSFYNHFKSKEALAVEVIRHYVVKIVLPLLSLEGPPSAIERVGESKFIPIFCELFEDGSPYLPTYLKSRFAIDFSSEAKVDENWETLIRALFGRPLYQKPALGTPPAYVTAPPGTLQEPSRPSASKFLSWRQVGARHAIR